MRGLIDRIVHAPRAVQWLLAFAAFLLLYLFAVEPALDNANLVRDRADRLEASLRRERGLQSGSRAGDLERSITTFGVPRHPTDPLARPEGLQRAVDGILARHGVGTASYTERSGSIRAEDAGGVVNAASKLERYVLDVSFEASPTTVTAILSDLEQAPEVTAISRVKIDKAVNSRTRGESDAPSRIVRAVIVVESWIAAPASAGSTASAAWEGHR